MLAGWLVSSVAFFLLGRANLLTRGWVCKRICISAYLLLVIVLAIVLLPREKVPAPPLLPLLVLIIWLTIVYKTFY